jgi:DNA-binding response OmpR family regulator
MANAVRRPGHSVTLVLSSAVAKAFLAESWPDMVVLDLERPRRQSRDAIKKLCEQQRYVPVLAVIEPDGVDGRVRALKMGADDCLGKPFSLKEFEARVEALRRPLYSPRQSVYQWGSLTLDFVTRTARIHGRTLELSKTEVVLFGVLMRSSGRVVGMPAMLDALNQRGDRQVKPEACMSRSTGYGESSHPLGPRLGCTGAEGMC